MNLAGSVSHPFRIRFASFSILVHGLGRTIPFLGGAKWSWCAVIWGWHSYLTSTKATNHH
eukprot:6319236-Prymnesium_polylepis.1